MPAADAQIEVATGRVCLSIQGNTCHGQPIPPDMRKVQIDVCMLEARLFKLPISVANVVDINEAVGSYVLWPKNGISAVDDDEPVCN